MPGLTLKKRSLHSYVLLFTATKSWHCLAMFFQVLHTGGKKDRDYPKLQINAVQFHYITLSLHSQSGAKAVAQPVGIS